MYFLCGGGLRGEAVKLINKFMRSQCLIQETNTSQMYLMMLKIWALLGKTNINQPSSMLYVISQAMASGKISQIPQELLFHSLPLCTKSPHCSFLFHARSFLWEYILCASFPAFAKLKCLRKPIFLGLRRQGNKTRMVHEGVIDNRRS